MANINQLFEDLSTKGNTKHRFYETIKNSSAKQLSDYEFTLETSQGEWYRGLFSGQNKRIDVTIVNRKTGEKVTEPYWNNGKYWTESEATERIDNISSNINHKLTPHQPSSPTHQKIHRDFTQWQATNPFGSPGLGLFAPNPLAITPDHFEKQYQQVEHWNQQRIQESQAARHQAEQRHQELLNEQKISQAEFFKKQQELREETTKKQAHQRQQEEEQACQAEIDRLKKEAEERQAEEERLRLIQAELERKRQAYRSLLQSNLLTQMQEQQHQLEITNQQVEATSQALKEAQNQKNQPLAKKLNAEYNELRKKQAAITAFLENLKQNADLKTFVRFQTLAELYDPNTYLEPASPEQFIKIIDHSKSSTWPKIKPYLFWSAGIILAFTIIYYLIKKFKKTFLN